MRYFGPSEVKIAACILHILSLIITLGPIWTSWWPEPRWFSSVWGPMHDTLTTVWNLCSIAPWSGQTNKIKAIVRSCLCHGSLKPVVGVPQLNCHPVVSSCGIIAYIKKTSLATHVDIKAQNLLWEEEYVICAQSWFSSLNVLVVWDTKW